MKKQIKVSVTNTYTITVDTENPIVKDYDTENEMLQHIIDYRFSDVLPVMSLNNGGVEVNDIENTDWKILN